MKNEFIENNNTELIKYKSRDVNIKLDIQLSLKIANEMGIDLSNVFLVDDIKHKI